MNNKWEKSESVYNAATHNSCHNCDDPFKMLFSEKIWIWGFNNHWCRHSHTSQFNQPCQFRVSC